MLRAYLRLITDEFESRHDLRKLAAEAKFFDIVPDELQEEFGAKFSELNLRWRSNQRYSTEKQLWSYLSSVRADFKQRGNPYKNHSRTLLNLALDVINLGARKWQRSQQSQTPSSTP